MGEILARLWHDIIARLPELEQEILEPRKAARYADALPVKRNCQIFTNLGNALSRCGRFIDALPAWDKVLTLNSDFGMAVGNRAIELLYYSRLLWRAHDQIVLLQESALPLPDYAKLAFMDKKAWIECHVKSAVFKRRHDLNAGDIGASDEERIYRQWCLHERLFLNPTNDLGPCPAGASDPIVLPPIRTGMDEGPRHIGLSLPG